MITPSAGTVDHLSDFNFYDVSTLLQDPVIGLRGIVHLQHLTHSVGLSQRQLLVAAAAAVASRDNRNVSLLFLFLQNN